MPFTLGVARGVPPYEYLPSVAALMCVPREDVSLATSYASLLQELDYEITTPDSKLMDSSPIE